MRNRQRRQEKGRTARRRLAVVCLVLTCAGGLGVAAVRAQSGGTITTNPGPIFGGGSGGIIFTGVGSGSGGGTFTNPGGSYTLTPVEPTVPDRSSDFTLTTLHRMGEDNDGGDPRSPLVRGADGSFYGYTHGGGKRGVGVLYKVTPGGDYTVLHTFGQEDKTWQPYNDDAPLCLGLADNGSLYGATNGTVFKLGTDGTFSVLKSFVQDDINSVVVDPDGSLLLAYAGTLGSSKGDGVVARVAPDGAFTTVHTFTNARLLPGTFRGSDGCLHGVLDRGVPASAFYPARVGFFTLRPDGSVTIFDCPSDNGEPNGGLIQATDGGYYGTVQGGTYNLDPFGYRKGYTGGLVFAYQPGGYGAGSVHDFQPTADDGTNADGADPRGGVAEGGDGFLYGTTAHGGQYGFGTLYRVALADGAFITLYHFTGAEDGGNPMAPPVPDGAGGLLGTTSASNDHLYAGTPAAAKTEPRHNGTVYRFVPATGALTTVYGFGFPEGAGPAGNLAEGDDGSLYGVSTAGGARGFGTIFSVSPEGKTVTRYSFNHAEKPFGLVRAGGGVFYGSGTQEVFRFAMDGSYRSVWTFANESLAGGVILGRDGALYGATRTAAGTGAVFRLTPEGGFSVVHALADAEGGAPTSALVQGPDGALYGTTRTTVFRVGPGGTLTTLATLKVDSQGFGANGVTLGGDGCLHGSYSKFGQNYISYKVTPDGTLTLGTVPNTEGLSSSAVRFGDTGVTLGTDGALYGATYDEANGVSISSTGLPENGSLFRATDDNQRAFLHHFTGDENGGGPGGLITGRDGALYGVTSVGGVNGQGTVFRLDKAPPPVLKVPKVAPVVMGSGKRGYVTVSLPAVRTDDVLVHYEVKGSAVPGVDYAPLKGTLKIRAGRGSASLKIKPRGDLGGAAQKTVVVVLTPDESYDLSGVKPVKVKLQAVGQ